MMETFSRPNSQDKPTVVAIDDDSFGLTILSELLTSDGYSVIPGSNAKDLWSILSNLTPHVILLDVTLPDEDGFSICRKLRSDTRFAYTVIMFITSKDSQTDILEGFQAGGHDYITKPFLREILTARLGTHVRFQQAVLKLKNDNDRMQMELKLAGVLQRTVMTMKPWDRSNYLVRTVYCPTSEVGGDFFDILEDSNGDLWVYIGDVAGHGVGAALIASALHGILHEIIPSMGRLGPAEICNGLHAQFLRLIPSKEHYATFFIAQIKSDGSSLRAMSCGHPRPFILSPQGSDYSQTLEENGGVPIGFAMAGTAPYSEADEVSLELLDGSALLLFTDGITEARHALSGEQCPREELVEYASQALFSDMPDPAFLLDKLGAKEYQTGKDDCSAVALRFLGKDICRQSWTIPCTLEPIGLWGAQVEAFLTQSGWNENDAFRVRLVAVEHATNVVKHGRSEHGATMDALLLIFPQSARLYVEDAGQLWDPPGARIRLEDVPLDNEGGRGLGIIDTLCASISRGRRGTLNTAAFVIVQESGSLHG
jgi:sigma-B regulation protein RsbU (phosphoserine phosphatase)